MTRRTFLRVLGAGVAATAVVGAVPEVLTQITSSVSAGPMWDRGSCGAITYEMLEAAYKSCVAGAERPTYMVVSQSMARRYGLVFDVEFEEAA